jgi:hypothetical protein
MRYIDDTPVPISPELYALLVNEVVYKIGLADRDDITDADRRMVRQTVVSVARQNEAKVIKPRRPLKLVCELVYDAAAAMLEQMRLDAEADKDV